MSHLDLFLASVLIDCEDFQSSLYSHFELQLPRNHIVSLCSLCKVFFLVFLMVLACQLVDGEVLIEMALGSQ